MNVTVSLEKHMDNAFEKFHNNLKFYNIDVSSEMLDHLDTLEADMLRLSKETRTTEIEEKYEEGWQDGLQFGSEEAHHHGYEQGYDLGYEAGKEESDREFEASKKSYRDGYEAAVKEFKIDMTGHK